VSANILLVEFGEYYLPNSGLIKEGVENVAALMKIKDFRYLWSAGGLYHIARWMDPVVMGLMMLELTGSAAQVAILLGLKWSPMLLFASFSGYISMLFSRKKVMLITQAGTAVIMVSLLLLTIMGLTESWHLQIGAFLLGVFYVLDFPAKRTSIHDVSQSNRLSNAMFLDIINHALGKGVGPFLAGAAIYFFSYAGAFTVLLCLSISSFALLLNFNFQQPAVKILIKELPREFVQGFSRVLGNKVILGFLLSNLIFNWFVFSCESLLPVVATIDLKVNPLYAGILVSAFGTGAFVGGLTMTFVGNMELKGRVLTFGILIQILGFFVFGLSGFYMLSYVFLFVAGFGNALLSAMGTSIVLLNISQKDRPVGLGIVGQFVGSAAFGGYATAYLASQFGASTTMVINQIAGLSLFILVLMFFPIFNNRT
jgi:MFS family permease